MTDEATNAAERGSATTATRGGGEDARKSLDVSLGSARRDARRETRDARKDDARMRANESARFLSTRVSTDERSFARAQRETRGES